MHLEGEAFVLHRGEPLTGVTFSQPVPEGDYELTLDATKLEGHDFFVGLTFPVPAAEGHLTLVLGGWGGALCGLSCIDDEDASSNETKFFEGFDTGQEYAVRLEVEGPRIRVEVDGERVIDFDSTGHELSLRTEVEPCRPLGIATFLTKARIRNLRWRSR